MSDLIDRQDAIDELDKGAWGVEWDKTLAKAMIESLSSVQPTLYGYKVELLAYIARVMQKEGVSAEHAVRTFDDMSRALKMIIEEANEKVTEYLEGMYGKNDG